MLVFTSLQPGDLIFTGEASLLTNNTLSSAISQVGLNYSKITFDHVGMYIGNNQVVESAPPVVKVSKLVNFITNPKTNTFYKIAIKRPINSTLVKNAIGFATAQIGAPYNHYYLKNNHSFYCSDLIIKAFYYANGQSNYFAEHQLSFNNQQTQEIDSIWLNKYGGKSFIPSREMGSHPSSLLESSLLKSISHNFIAPKTPLLAI